MSAQMPKTVLRVRLVDGSEVAHMYDTPANITEAWEFLNQMVDMIARGLSRQSTAYLVFESPSCWYNPDNVLSVGIEPPEGTEFARMVADMHRSMRLKQATTRTAKA